MTEQENDSIEIAEYLRAFLQIPKNQRERYKLCEEVGRRAYLESDSYVEEKVDYTVCEATECPYGNKRISTGLFCKEGKVFCKTNGILIKKGSLERMAEFGGKAIRLISGAANAVISAGVVYLSGKEKSLDPAEDDEDY
jgi:hypothetical protein